MDQPAFPAGWMIAGGDGEGQAAGRSAPPGAADRFGPDPRTAASLPPDDARLPPARGPRPAALVALFLAAVAVFNFPLLLVWDQPVTVFSLPLLGVALFVLWAALIAALAWISER